MPSDYTYPPGDQFGKITCQTLEKALHLLSPSNKSHMASDLPCNQVKEPPHEKQVYKTHNKPEDVVSTTLPSS